MLLELIGYCLAFFVGLILGLLGGGGSILAVPIMVVFFGITAEIATTYSLFIIGITSLFGTFKNVRNRLVHPRNAILFSIPAVVSITITRLLIMPVLPKIIHFGERVVFEKNTFIMILFAILMILASIPMIRGQIERPMAKRPRPGILMGLGLLVGCISGVIGAGGGFLIIPALSIFMKVPIKNAIATSIMIISINSIAGFTADFVLQTHEINWIFLGLFTLIAIGGLIVGSIFTTSIPADRLRKSFGVFVLGIGLFIVVYESIQSY